MSQAPAATARLPLAGRILGRNSEPYVGPNLGAGGAGAGAARRVTGAIVA
jgi:hypothetical protein